MYTENKLLVCFKEETQVKEQKTPSEPFQRSKIPKSLVRSEEFSIAFLVIRWARKSILSHSAYAGLGHVGLHAPPDYDSSGTWTNQVKLRRSIALFSLRESSRLSGLMCNCDVYININASSPRARKHKNTSLALLIFPKLTSLQRG